MVKKMMDYHAASDIKGEVSMQQKNKTVFLSPLLVANDTKPKPHHQRSSEGAEGNGSWESGSEQLQ